MAYFKLAFRDESPSAISASARSIATSLSSAILGLSENEAILGELLLGKVGWCPKGGGVRNPGCTVGGVRGSRVLYGQIAPLSIFCIINRENYHF